MNNFIFTQVIIFFTVLSGANAFISAHADEAVSKSKSMKVIDFEGDVVEGINKQSLDSLNQISEEEKRKRRNHLYQKRKSFKSEDKDMIGELRIHL